jgi:hypothetical protein
LITIFCTSACSGHLLKGIAHAVRYSQAALHRSPGIPRKPHSTNIPSWAERIIVALTIALAVVIVSAVGVLMAVS